MRGQLALGLLALAVAAQDVKFKSTSQLVVEAVSVKDKSGRPIEGLTAADFRVSEDGKPQAIRVFEFQRLTDDAATLPAPVADDGADPVTVHQIAPESPGKIRYKDRRLLAFYFELTAMGVADKLRAMDAARKFLTTQMTAPDMVALLSYDGSGVQVLTDFTNDREDLLRRIGKMFVGDKPDDPAGDDSDPDDGSAFGQDSSEFNVFSTDRQMAALQTAVKMLGTLQEKKSLVYFSSGLRLNGVNNQAQLQATVNAAVRANVSLYPVDARGLVAQAPLGDVAAGSPGGQGMYSGSSALAAANNFSRSQDTLYTLAADTGGKAWLDTNDVGGRIVQAQKAMGSYYMIGYYSTNDALDGKFRRIKIELKDAAAKLDYRSGYYAGKEFGKFTAADKERQLEDALMLGDPVTDLTMASEIDYFQLNRSEYYVPVMVKIPGSELVLARRGGAEYTSIDFIGEVKDAWGGTVQNVRDKVDIKLNGSTATELGRRPIEYETGFTLIPGTYRIKLLARDAETGRIGTYLQKFVVPNLSKEETRVAISSVVLSGQQIDLKDALYTAKNTAASVNPLVHDGQRLIPSVTRVFRQEGDVYLFLQAYQPASATARPLLVHAALYRGSSKVAQTPVVTAREPLDDRLKTLPVRLTMPLRGIAPGRYTCQVSVVDPQGGKATFWQAPIVVVANDSSRVP